MPLEQIARILYNMSRNMDYADNLEHAEEKITCLKKELLVLNDHGCNSLLQTLEIIAMQNKNMEFWKESMGRVSMIQIEFYIECFDRELILEINPEDEKRVQEIMQLAYDYWIENPDAVGDECCEEYICNRIKEAGIYFKWRN